MSNTKPGFVDPYRMAKTEQTLTDKVSVADLDRVKKLLLSDLGEVKYHLDFSTDAEGYCVIGGKLDTILTMRCQRCLQNFQKAITAEFLVSPVTNDEGAKALPSSYEPVYTADGKIYPLEFIEDELILAMPIVPLHDFESTDCVAVTTTAEQDAKQQKGNPFQVLKDIL